MIAVSLRADGVLWAVNRVLFHPRGFAIGVDTTTGDLVLFGDGSGPWRYATSAETPEGGELVDEDAAFRAFEALLSRAREASR